MSGQWKTRRVAPALLGVVVAMLGISGCSEQRTLSDLERYVSSLHADIVPQVDPLPEQPPVVTVIYTADESKDPFAPSNVYGKDEILAEAKTDSAPEIDPLAPDPARLREPLERYPLDALELVGTMRLDAGNWALVKSPDGQIHRVVVGSYLGQNIGKIVAINEKLGSLEIEELVLGTSGRWEIRLTGLKTGG